MGKTILIIILILIACALIVGVILYSTQEVEEVVDMAAECEEQGGHYTIGGSGMPFCYLPTADAGNPCTDNDECESFCVAEEESATEGTCYPETPFSGCWWVLEDGATKGQVCD